MFNKIIDNFKNFFQSENRHRLFKICIPALIIVASFTLMSFFPMYISIKDTKENSSKLIIDTAIKSLNDIFKNIDNTYKSIENEIDKEVLYGENGIINYDNDLSSYLTDTLKSVTETNNFIEEIVILKKNEDLVLTTQGVMLKRDFFNKNYASEVYGANFFDNLATDYQNVKIIPSSSYKNMEKYPAEDPQNLMVCVKRHVENNTNMLLFISYDKFVKSANLSLLGEGINFKIYDYNDSVIYSNSDSEYMINTINVSEDFKEQVINLGFKKYYIIKSSYNYYYYVAEIKDNNLLVFIFSFIFLLAGFIIGAVFLMKSIYKIDAEIVPVFSELEIENNEGVISDIKDKMKAFKENVSKKSINADIMSEEIKSSIFLKTVTSSSFYSRFKNTVDSVFSDILKNECFFMLSLEIIRENLKLPKYEFTKTEEFLNENGLNFILIEEKSRKFIYVIGCDKGTHKEIAEKFSVCLSDIRKNNIEILASYSREYSNLGNLYEAYHDINISRGYRGIDDKTSFLSYDDIEYGNRIYLPPNFKEELAGKIMAKEEISARNYIKEIFEENIKNNIPLSKFEFMLRQMLSTVTDTLSSNKKSNSDMYQLEQVFLGGIEQLKENHDVYGVMNSFINLVHLSINMYDTKKSSLNRAEIIKYINSNYKKDLYLEKIAVEFNTTPKYFSNYFKKEFSLGFSEYLTNLRISQAKKLLCETDKPLNAVSEEVGYLNQATFAAAFKKVTGLPPGKYREINK